MVEIQLVGMTFIAFFALAGMVRGTAKEIVALAGLVLTLFIIRFFGPIAMARLGLVVDQTNANVGNTHRTQFWVFTFMLVMIAFFSYQGPSLAGANRFTRRDSIQDRMLGFVLGGINGWLLSGTVLSLLENRLQWVGEGVASFVRLPFDQQYPIEGVVRAQNVATDLIYNYLPLSLFGGSIYVWALIMVALFLFVLVVLI